MKEIKLTRGKVVLVDDKDFEFLNQHKWHVKLGKYTCYGQRDVVVQSQNMKIGLKVKTKSLFIHRVIMEDKLKRKLEKTEQVDHINGNGLDNQFSNLRLCSNSQNAMNSRKRKGSSSQYKGVNWSKQKSKWRSRIKLDYKEKFLGYFDNEIEAAKAYDKKAKELFGEFAKLNFT